MSYVGYNIEVSTPSAIEKTFKKDLQHMADIGILEGYRAYGWAFPCFIITKKTAESDKSMTSYLSTNVQMQKTNVCYLCIFQRVYGYKYYIKFDTSKQCFTFELDEES